jgi:hypothetical protein
VLHFGNAGPLEGAVQDRSKALPGEKALDKIAVQRPKDEHEDAKIIFSILEQGIDDLEAKGSLNKEHLKGTLGFLIVCGDRWYHGWKVPEIRVRKH